MILKRFLCYFVCLSVKYIDGKDITIDESLFLVLCKKLQL